MKRFNLWFVDADGNEDFITLSITEHERELLARKMRERKDAGTISDYVLVTDSPYGYEGALDYIADKLQDDDADVSA